MIYFTKDVLAFGLLPVLVWALAIWLYLKAEAPVIPQAHVMNPQHHHKDDYGKASQHHGQDGIWWD